MHENVSNIKKKKCDKNLKNVVDNKTMRGTDFCCQIYTNPSDEIKETIRFLADYLCNVYLLRNIIK